MENSEIKKALDEMIGVTTGPRTMDYTWRDVILYALAVGAHKEDLPYVYEKGGLKTLPTFGVLPYLNSILMSPRKRTPYNPHTLVKELITRKTGLSPAGLHMSMDMVMHRPADPMKGTFMCEDSVTNIYDRGEGKGIAIECQMLVSDTAGQPVCTLTSTHGTFIWGGYGGEKMVSPKCAYPEREPDFVVKDYMLPTQALLYRLLGDTYDIHVDIHEAQSKGFKDPFMQGLCTYGFACRMAIQAMFPYEPERVTRFYAQMRSLCYPGSEIELRAWKLEDGKLIFRLFNEEGKAVLDNGILEYRP